MDKDKKLFSFRKNEFPLILAIVAMVFIVVSWMNFGPLLAFAVARIPFANWNMEGVGDYLIVHTPYFLMFLSLFAISNLLLKTDLRTIITGIDRKFRYKMALKYGGIYIAYLAVLSLISFKTIDIDPTPFKQKLSYLLPVLILTPMQALSEEIFFRALPARIVFKNNLPKTINEGVALSIMSGMLFVIPHLGNPEVVANSEYISALAYYFIWGALAMAIGVYTDGFEIPVAIHIANNLYTALLVNYEGGAMPTHALFINRKTTPSNWITVVEAIIIFAILFFVAYQSKKKENGGLDG
jgi:membrane protease YdiL (CAAX protease family)